MEWVSGTLSYLYVQKRAVLRQTGALIDKIIYYFSLQVYHIRLPHTLPRVEPSLFGDPLSRYVVGYERTAQNIGQKSCCAFIENVIDRLRM